MSRPEPSTKRVSTNWTDAVLVCRKCSKKLGGGFGSGGKQTLAKVLRQATGQARSSKTRRQSCGVVEVPCLDICPKRGVVALRAGAPGRWVVIPKGLPVETIVRDLGLSAPLPMDALPSDVTADMRESA